MVRIFKNKRFVRFARKERISDRSLCEAVQKAEKGLVDADLGGGVIKQRIARPGEGESSGFRSIVLFRNGDKLTTPLHNGALTEVTRDDQAEDIQE